ncbi:MAG: hypothetical protein ACR2PH_12485 [Desulfobulbia bacterium]
MKGIEREVYLFCDTIQTKENILKQFPSLTPNHLEEMIKEWIDHRWMFRDEDSFLSLAIKLDSGMPPLTYFSQIYPYTEKFLDRFKHAPGKSQASFKRGSIATLNLSRVPNKVRAWLKFPQGR